MIWVDNRGHEVEVCETGARRLVVGYEDICLPAYQTHEAATKRSNTNPFEIAVNKPRTVEVFKTVRCAMQLLLYINGASDGESEDTHQFHPVDANVLNVFHDSSVCHPLRNCGELSFLHVPLNPGEFQDIRMG